MSTRALIAGIESRQSGSTATLHAKVQDAFLVALGTLYVQRSALRFVRLSLLRELLHIAMKN